MGHTQLQYLLKGTQCQSTAHPFTWRKCATFFGWKIFNLSTESWFIITIIYTILSLRTSYTPTTTLNMFSIPMMKTPFSRRMPFLKAPSKMSPVTLFKNNGMKNLFLASTPSLQCWEKYSIFNVYWHIDLQDLSRTSEHLETQCSKLIMKQLGFLTLRMKVDMHCKKL